VVGDDQDRVAVGHGRTFVAAPRDQTTPVTTRVDSSPPTPDLLPNWNKQRDSRAVPGARRVRI
jgi:hypothetical protein